MTSTQYPLHPLRALRRCKPQGRSFISASCALRLSECTLRAPHPTRAPALLIRKLGSVSLGLHAHKDYLAHTGVSARLEDLAAHCLIGFDRETPALRVLRSRAPGGDAMHFAFRAYSDIAQWRAIKAGFGIGICQLGLAKQEPVMVHLLPKAFELKLGFWLAMHENLRATPRCRATFDVLEDDLAQYMRC